MKMMTILSKYHTL